MLKILLSNDDGILAPGLLKLRDYLKEIAYVVVIAPETDSSGGGSSISLSSVLRVQQIEKDFFALKGTPADCVHAALTGLLPFTPDLVVSGINNRSNLGDDIIYSGTFGAAFEGRKLKFPAMALSMVSHAKEPNFETGAKVCLDIIEKLQNQTFYKQGVLNINIPDLDYKEIKGVKITKLGQRPLSNPIIKHVDPRGNDFFWLGSRKDPEDYCPNSDFYAVKNHYVSLSPINTVFMDENLASDLSEMFK
jgi:5'-nucleotidase